MKKYQLYLLLTSLIVGTSSCNKNSDNSSSESDDVIPVTLLTTGWINWLLIVFSIISLL